MVTIATPAALAAAIDSPSRIDPLGWTMAVTPALIAVSTEREKEEGIGLRHRSHGLLASSPGDNAHAINPVRLPNADAHRGWQGARS